MLFFLSESYLYLVSKSELLEDYLKSSSAFQSSITHWSLISPFLPTLAKVSIYWLGLKQVLQGAFESTVFCWVVLIASGGS